MPPIRLGFTALSPVDPLATFAASAIEYFVSIELYELAEKIGFGLLVVQIG
jgi:hypothetical protein